MDSDASLAVDRQIDADVTRARASRRAAHAAEAAKCCVIDAGAAGSVIMRRSPLAQAFAAAVVTGCAGCTSAAMEAPVAAGGADASTSDAGEGGVARKDSGVTDPCAAFLGDPRLPPQIELTVLVADGSQMPLKDGDAVPLIFPPQSGRVVFVGLRATNVHPCAVQVVGRVRDEKNGAIRTDARVVDLKKTGDGWGVTGSDPGGGIVFANISSVSNIPLCPNSWSATDVFDHSYELTLTITDAAKLTASTTIHVTPTCSEPGRVAECQCICAQKYVLGQACTPATTDAGDGG